jgi:choline transport protein
MPFAHQIDPSKQSSGGPAGVIYGYLVVWFGTVSVFMVLSELVSM